MSAFAKLIAQELNVGESQVAAAMALLDGGATVPFIARYRKEVTGGLDDSQLRRLEERLYYLRELQERRETILESIKSQEKLTPELEQAINQADTKTRLEDIYLPYRPKRRTKALIAREAGLEPLALKLWHEPEHDPQEAARAFINEEHNITDEKAALEGARQILMERFAEDAELLDECREYLWKHAKLTSTVFDDKKQAGKKFADYFDFAEAIHKIPSHRALALFRGRREAILKLSLELPEEQADYGVQRLCQRFRVDDQGRAADAWMQESLRWTWKIKIFTKLELELMARLRERAEEEAILVFASNLRDLLLAAPAGEKVTIGLDPGIRTGVKLAIIDETGKVLDTDTLFPLAPMNQWHQSLATLAKLVVKNKVALISIGNGTGSRETDRLVAELIKMYPDLKLTKIIVNEAGASVYSASELASKEFPDLDVTLRGAVSIARRLQDPLAELVKIEPKSIGVGQYQHDVNQTKLARSLESVVEDCVNAVGVDVNTASASLLARVAGLNESLANNIVEYRNQEGAFSSRDDLKSVARMGAKTFEQAAGFLRINNGQNPLDASAVHPESYPLVEHILKANNKQIDHVIGDKDFIRHLSAKDYVTAEHGLPTIVDVLKELEKPGRDPRPEFKTANFKEGVESLEHLSSGMVLEGVVSNVTNFGAFIDVGVHQDGLVHISEMTDQFIDDPRKVVKAGDIVKVRVLDVDLERRRLSLSMKLSSQAKPAPRKDKPAPQKFGHKKVAKPKAQKPAQKKKQPAFNTAMADAFAKLKSKK